LRPIQATLKRCKVHYLPAFVTYNVERVSDEALRAEADRYAEQVLAPAVVESRY
ncbi:general stress protein, partial [Clostridium perfringens]